MRPLPLRTPSGSPTARAFLASVCSSIVEKFSASAAAVTAALSFAGNQAAWVRSGLVGVPKTRTAGGGFSFGWAGLVFEMLLELEGPQRGPGVECERTRASGDRMGRVRHPASPHLALCQNCTCLSSYLRDNDYHNIIV